MRQLRLVFAQTDKMTKVLVAATILPLTGSCGGRSDDGTTTPDQVVATGGNSSVGGASWIIGPNTGGSSSVGGAASVGGGGACPSYYSSVTSVVTLPSGDTPKDAAALCSNWTGTFASDRPAARVTLEYDPNVPTQAKGTVTIDPEVLSAAGSGYFSVSSVVANGATISNLVRVNDAFTFNVDFTSSPYLGMQLTFQVKLDFTCAPTMSSTRTLQAASTVELCGTYGAMKWVSTGDTCAICYPMAEMAAQLMPTPANESDNIPLSGEIDVRIVEVAREGRTVVLMAQTPKGADGLALTWQTSAGHLMIAADDVAVWSLPSEPGPHLVQVAAELGPSASIAAYLHRDKA